jgi:hypothetical protein
MTSISEQELLEAISPRPYGTSIDFFQLAWDIMKKELLSAVKESRESGITLKAMNSAFLTLIPKKKNALSFDSFKPISLCNYVYKTITKIVGSRLKPSL